MCTVVSAYFLLTAIAAQQLPAPAEAVDTPFAAGVSDVASLQKAVEARLATAQRLLNDLVAVTGPRTIANTLAPYDELRDHVQAAGSLAALMAAVHPDAAMRKVALDLERRADAFDADISLRPDVFSALQRLRLDALDAESRYYVERTLGELRRLGVDRPEATRTRLKGLRDELSVLMAEFLKNIREGARRFTVRRCERPRRVTR